jgi:GYF domain 2
MDIEKSWYYLNRSRQIGPFSQSELRLLFAKEVISPNTLVWSPGSSWCAVRDLPNEPVIEAQKQRQNWAAVAIGICVFFLGIGVVLEVPPTSESHIAFAMTSKEQEPQRFLDKVGADHVPGKEAAVIHPDFASLSYRTSLTARTRTSTDRQLVQEFWRSIAYSDVADRYHFYLRRYPSGPFAETASARIRALREITEGEVIKSKIGIAKKKPSSIASKVLKTKKLAKATAVKTAIAKPAGRCGGRHVGQCRQRCRDGDARACQDLRKLND